MQAHCMTWSMDSKVKENVLGKTPKQYFMLLLGELMYS